MILALPQGKSADHVTDVLIDHVQGLPALVRKSLTWDQGTEMGRHAAVTVATDLPVFFADPHSPWQRPTNENTNRMSREYLPKGTDIEIGRASCRERERISAQVVAFTR